MDATQTKTCAEHIIKHATNLSVTVVIDYECSTICSEGSAVYLKMQLPGSKDEFALDDQIHQQFFTPHLPLTLPSSIKVHDLWSSETVTNMLLAELHQQHINSLHFAVIPDAGLEELQAALAAYVPERIGEFKLRIKVKCRGFTTSLSDDRPLAKIFPKTILDEIIRETKAASEKNRPLF